MAASEFPQIPDDVSGAYPGPTEAQLAEIAEAEESAAWLAERDARVDWAQGAADDAAVIVAAEAAREAGLDPLSVLWDQD